MLQLSINPVAPFSIYDEVENAVTPVSARIHHLERGGNKLEIGSIHAFILDPADLTEGVSFCDVLNYIEPRLTHYCELLFNNGTGSPRPVLKAIGYEGGRILIIDSLNISSAWRGNRIGLAAIRRLVRITSVSLATLIAEPLEPGVDNYEELQARLADYYGLLGFRPLAHEGLDSHYLALNTSRALPSIERVA